MKTNYTTLSAAVLNARKNEIRILSVIIGLLLSCLVSAQQAHVGLTVSSSVSGNGFGSIYAPAVSTGFGNYTISCSPLFQKRDANFAGVRLGVERLLCVNVTGRLRLSAVYEASAYSRALLGRNNLLIEKNITPENSERLNTLTYRGGEQYLGFMIDTKIARFIGFQTAIGFGHYFSNENGGGSNAVYRDAGDVCLQVKAGLRIGLAAGND